MMNRQLSAHMADIKGKRICYDHDDEPIQLTDEDDSPTIKDYRMSLIGKILNPKKQSVVKLIQTMPAQWKMQDRITANDLSEVEALRWAMENMLQYSNCQSFGTDCKELIAMVKDPQAWPSFSTELERIGTLQICFPAFKISHVPRTHNRTADFLAKTARSFHRELHFVGCSIPVWLPRPPQV
ncbi:hypothetical protein F2Q69_00036753 [Brassica cretica]|uniref:RNase H type-1 domain-containing protein n=1 Tax=Brassica cretica TaxID=69181 RepID=A0A8S9SRH2_BRACR|nr:hypothetical protein F2Q69_00036753 [Brassica cretica]